MEKELVKTKKAKEKVEEGLRDIKEVLLIEIIIPL